MDSNLRTSLEKILRRAGVKQWPKLWKNLRASGATDFAQSLPSHVAATICCHTEQIAQEHNWTVTDNDLDIAMEKLSTKVSTKVSTNAVSEGLPSSLNVSLAIGAETKKAHEIQGFDAICRLMSSLGELMRVDDRSEEHTSELQSL